MRLIGKFKKFSGVIPRTPTFRGRDKGGMGKGRGREGNRKGGKRGGVGRRRGREGEGKGKILETAPPPYRKAKYATDIHTIYTRQQTVSQ
jgi:hypothetical protein